MFFSVNIICVKGYKNMQSETTAILAPKTTNLPMIKQTLDLDKVVKVAKKSRFVKNKTLILKNIVCTTYM